MSNDGNKFVIRVFITGGADPTTRTINEAVAAYDSDSKNSVVGFNINYTGTAKKGTTVDEYDATLPSAERSITFGRWASASLGISGDSVNLINAKVKPIEIPTAKDVIIEGDIMSGEDTQHENVFEAKAGDTLPISGTFTTDLIKKQIVRIGGDAATDADKESLELNKLSSTFVTNITLPEGMSFSENLTPENTVLEGVDGMFKVSDVSVNGQTVKVTMSLITDNIQNFKQLETAVLGADDTLKITVPGVKVSESTADGTKYTIKGEAGGDFTANVKSNTGVEADFAFDWNAVQSDEGRDSTLEDGDKTISFTLKVKNEKTSTPGDKEDNPTNTTTTENEDSDSTPKTGDNTPFIPYVITMGAAILGLGVMIRRKANRGAR